MSKKSHKALASATVMSLVLTSALTATNNVQAAAKVERMPGADRFATAQEVAKQSFGKAENVVLVNGLGYADAVSATPLAKQLDAPILLTDAEDKPSAKLLATLTDLGAKNVYIIGGTGVVTEAMEKELAKTYKVERIAGDAKDGRYGTNAAVAKKVIEKTKATEGILVSAEGYADALSVASIAATKGMPVLFANKNEVPAVVKDAAKDMKKVMAVGGEGVLPDAVLKAVNAERIAKGADRFETNLTVLKHFGADLKFDNIFVAAGGDDSKSKFADALVASAAAAKFGAPVVLNGLGANETRVKEANKFVKDHMGDNTKVTIVGGEASVSKDIENELAGKKASTGKAEVQSMEALNLNQVKIVFDSKVNDKTAEDVSNYELDGEQLQAEKKDEKGKIKEANAVAKLQDDDRTVILTLANPKNQEKDMMLKVRKGILNKEKSKIVPEIEKKITFKDIQAPKVEEVSVKGNSKIKVKFSEALFVKGDDNKKVIEQLADKLEINDQSVKSIGYNENYSKLKNSVKAEDKKGYYVNEIEFYFDSSLSKGENKLTVPDGKKCEYLIDAAGFAMKESDTTFKVETETSKPKVKSIEGSTEGKIFINFDRPMDAKTATKLENYRLNDDKITDAEIELKEGDTQVKISGITNIQVGSNTVSIINKVQDAFGNKVEDDTRIAFTAKKDEVKPKVSYVLNVNDNTIRVVFSKDVVMKVAREEENYTLKDSNGTKVNIEKPVKVADDIYDIKLKSGKLGDSKYTLEVKNIVDASGNVMDDTTTTLNGADVIPNIDVAEKVNDKDGHKVVLVFANEMKTSSINKLENYKYKNGKDNVKALPSDTRISVAADNKTVTIEFPSSYKVLSKVDKLEENSNVVKNIVVTRDVESTSGVKMDADETVEIQGAKNLVNFVVEKDPITLKEDGDDAIVIVRFKGAIKEIMKDQFKFAGEVADATNLKGEVVEFRFTGDKADKVKAAGTDLKVEVLKGVVLKDFALNEITDSDIDMSKAHVNTNEISPKLDYNKNGGYVDWVTNKDGEHGTLVVKFNTKLDASLENSYKDDFKFVSNKQSELKVQSAKVVDNTIVYTFEKAITDGEEITVTAQEKDIDIRTPKDDNGNGDSIKYVPASAEKGGLKVRVLLPEAKEPKDPKPAKVADEHQDGKENQAGKEAGKPAKVADEHQDGKENQAGKPAQGEDDAHQDGQKLGGKEAKKDAPEAENKQKENEHGDKGAGVGQEAPAEVPNADIDIFAKSEIAPGQYQVTVKLDKKADPTKWNVSIGQHKLEYDAKHQLFRLDSLSGLNPQVALAKAEAKAILKVTPIK